jgi:hypothetical protein
VRLRRSSHVLGQGVRRRRSDRRTPVATFLVTLHTRCLQAWGFPSEAFTGAGFPWFPASGAARAKPSFGLKTKTATLRQRHAANCRGAPGKRNHQLGTTHDKRSSARTVTVTVIHPPKRHHTTSRRRYLGTWSKTVRRVQIEEHRTGRREHVDEPVHRSLPIPSRPN